MTDIVTYKQFGAVGDGKTDDMQAICDAHAYANEHNLPVASDPDATYYIGGKDLTAIIKTSTNWSTSHFIIDDSDVENRNSPIFRVPALYEAEPVAIESLVRGQKHIDLAVSHLSMVSVKDETRRNYIRMGVNKGDGVFVSDTFLITPEGHVLNDIMWDFPIITKATIRRIEETPLTIKGGHFTTLVNQMPSFYTYYDRNIVINRSHVTVEGVTHRVEGEGEHGAPYAGFLSVSGCAYVTLLNCNLTGHKIFYTQGNGGMSPMGSYDIGLGSSAFVSLIGITQVPEIMDSTRWGLMGSNFCKDILLQNCEMSRFDAHMGVTNAQVIGCKLGWQCVHAIGEGDFLVEDCEIFGGAMVSLRYDYGGHWDGTMTIRNSKWYPKGEHPSVLAGANPGTHDFGYDCKMPHTVIIDGLHIVDTSEGIKDIALLNNYSETPHKNVPYPYQPPKKLQYGRIVCDSGREVAPYRDGAYYEGMELIKMEE